MNLSNRSPFGSPQHYLIVLLGLGLSAGCAPTHSPIGGDFDLLDADALALGPRQRPAHEIDCGSVHEESDGETYARPIVHDLDKLNLRLAASEFLQQQTGLAAVRDCHDAQALLDAQRNEEPETLEGLETPPADAEPEVVDKILRGTLERRRGSVRIKVFNIFGDVLGDCSGSLFSFNKMITSAHCFSALLGTSSGNVLMTVLYNAPGGQNVNVTATGNFTGGVGEVSIHPDFTSVSDTRDDIAVVKLVPAVIGNATTASSWQNLPGTDHNHFVSIVRDTAGKGQGVTVNGYGVFGSNGADGQSRTTREGRTMTVGWVSSDRKYFLNEAPSWGRMCIGDSGSMAIRDHRSASYALLGVHANSDRTTSQQCVPEGNKQRWTAVPPKADWITGGLCRSVNDSGLRTYECW